MCVDSYASGWAAAQIFSLMIKTQSFDESPPSFVEWLSKEAEMQAVELADREATKAALTAAAVYCLQDQESLPQELVLEAMMVGKYL